MSILLFSPIRRKQSNFLKWHNFFKFQPTVHIHPLYTEAPEPAVQMMSRRSSFVAVGIERQRRLRRRKPGSIGRTDGVRTAAAVSRAPSGQSSAIVWRATLSMSTCSQSRQRLRSSSSRWPLWPPILPASPPQSHLTRFFNVVEPDQYNIPSTYNILCNNVAIIT